jgi:hypothetical protein
VGPAGASSREARVDLPGRLPLAVRIFIVWLALVTWRRDEAAVPIFVAWLVLIMVSTASTT